MSVKLLSEHHLEFVCLKGGCRGSSESTHVKMPHCWKSHALDHYVISGAVEDQVFDAVLVCTGHHAMPHRPTFPGLDKYIMTFYAPNLKKKI